MAYLRFSTFVDEAVENPPMLPAGAQIAPFRGSPLRACRAPHVTGGVDNLRRLRASCR